MKKRNMVDSLLSCIACTNPENKQMRNSDTVDCIASRVNAAEAMVADAKKKVESANLNLKNAEIYLKSEMKALTEALDND